MTIRKGLTRIDLVVVLACAVFILANVPIILAGGRQHAKRDVCMANLRALVSAWDMYTDDNKGKIPPGDVYYSWMFPTSAGGPQLAWREWPHPFPHPMPPSIASNYSAAYPYGQITAEAWKHSIAEGLLWNYVKDFDIYKCPIGRAGDLVTYSMSQSMLTYPYAGGPGSTSRMITNKSQIAHPALRLVFLDTGWAKQGAFFLSYDGTSDGAPKGSWGDWPPMIHNGGTTFAFADGHTIYKKWTDPHALNPGGNGWGWGGTVDYCDCDLRWMIKITWGDVPYDCTDPAKNCED